MPDLVALDRNHSMVRNIWPGNTSGRVAIVGDWLNTNFRDASFSTCVGDGALNTVRYADQMLQVCSRVCALLRNQGRFVCRLYVRDTADTIINVVAAVEKGTIQNFHAFKMRLGMAIATESADPNVPVQKIREVFECLFSDREALVMKTGWSRAHIDTIDFYRNSSVEISYPSQDEFLDILSKVFPEVRLVSSGSYELAEKCPLVVANK